MNAEQVLTELEAKSVEILTAWQAAQNDREMYAVASAATSYFWPHHQGYDLNVQHWYADARHGVRIKEIVADLKAYDKRYKDYVWGGASLAEKRSINETEREYRLSAR